MNRRVYATFIITPIFLTIMSSLYLSISIAGKFIAVDLMRQNEPTAVLDASFYWIPNPAGVNQYVNGDTKIRHQALFGFIVVRYIVKVDERLEKPSIISTNLPYREFAKTSDGFWTYDSGCFIEIQPPNAIVTKYLILQTKASQTGRYIGIVRHPSLAEDPICGANQQFWWCKIESKLFSYS
ncbi:MAG: hypothetical protein QW330_01530 [Nitrososphaerota archaeon]